MGAGAYLEFWLWERSTSDSTTPGLYLRGTLFEVQFDRQFMLALELGQGLKLNAIISYRLTPPPKKKKKFILLF